MKSFKKSMAAAVFGLIMANTAIPAWSGTTVPQAVSGAVEMVSSNNLAPSGVIEHSWLKPSVADARPQASHNCKPGHLYTQHDLVGDPESCIMQGVSLAGAGISSAVAP
jgi:hypothetical protein